MRFKEVLTCSPKVHRISTLAFKPHQNRYLFMIFAGYNTRYFDDREEELIRTGKVISSEKETTF